MRASESGNYDVVVKILQANADPTIQDNDGHTAEYYAKLIHPESNIHTMLNNYTQEYVAKIDQK